MLEVCCDLLCRRYRKFPTECARLPV